MHAVKKREHALHITNLEGTLKGLDESSRTDIEPGLVGLFHGNSLQKYNCRGRRLDASLPAFFYLLSSKLKTQVADSLVYDPLVPHHPPHSSDTFSNKWNWRRFCHFGGNWRRKIWSHLRLLAAHLLASFKTASTEHYILFLLTLFKVQHLFLLHCMITIRVLSHSVLCSSAWLCLGWRRRSDSVVWSCASA